MPGRRTTPVAELVVLGPDGEPVSRFVVDRPRLLVGRAAGSDVHLHQPDVSRRHAELVATDGGVSVRDLGSTMGTYVDGDPVHGTRRLHDGDLVQFAGVSTRFSSLLPHPVERRGPDQQPGPQVQPGPYGRPGPYDDDTDAGARYDIDRQEAGTIHNVGRDQYVSYVHQIEERRAGFLQQIAATRSKARVLVWLGLAMQVGGFALFAGFVLRFITTVFDLIGTDSTEIPDVPDLTGPELLGLPMFVWGFVIAGVGGVLMVVGLILHVTATARARRVDRELPVPPPWQPPYR
jgi:hypothetical protein